MQPRLSQIDREALERALKLDGRKVRRGDDWWDEATSAAYSQQVSALHLKPWEDPPMWATDDRPGDDDRPHARKLAAWQLRRQLIAAGLSEFEPDPPAALEVVAARQRDRAGHLAPNGAKVDTRPPSRGSRGDRTPSAAFRQEVWEVVVPALDDADVADR